jgi:outer membrane receptor protein involved in Fe transport
LTGGLRLDRSRAYDAVRREWDAATGTLLLDAPGRTRSDTSPTARLGLRYAWSDDLHVRAAAYAGFRPPTLNELHRPFRVGNDVTEANPVLKPETLRGIEVGAGGEGAVRWSATLFYNRLSDPIANVTLGVGPETFPNAGFIPAGGTLRQRQNIGKIKAIGVEGEASGGGEAFSWRAAFAYVDAEVDGGQPAPQLTGLRPSQAPRWTVTGGLQFRPTATISLAADLRYESLRFEDDLNSRRLAPGVTLDARAGWRLRGDADVYVAADNLFGARLEVGETADGVGTYAAPRTIRIGLSIRR